jgi:hypothetical protein
MRGFNQWLKALSGSQRYMVYAGFGLLFGIAMYAAATVIGISSPSYAIMVYMLAGACGGVIRARLLKV